METSFQKDDKEAIFNLFIKNSWQSIVYISFTGPPVERVSQFVWLLFVWMWICKPTRNNLHLVCLKGTKEGIQMCKQ